MIYSLPEHTFSGTVQIKELLGPVRSRQGPETLARTSGKNQGCNSSEIGIHSEMISLSSQWLVFAGQVLLLLFPAEVT
jgi:hypothetical protein